LVERRVKLTLGADHADSYVTRCCALDRRGRQFVTDEFTDLSRTEHRDADQDRCLDALRSWLTGLAVATAASRETPALRGMKLLPGG